MISLVGKAIVIFLVVFMIQSFHMFSSERGTKIVVKTEKGKKIYFLELRIKAVCVL